MSTPQQPPWPARGLKPWDQALKAYIDFIASLIADGGGGPGEGGPLPERLTARPVVSAEPVVLDLDLLKDSGFYPLSSAIEAYGVPTNYINGPSDGTGPIPLVGGITVVGGEIALSIEGTAYAGILGSQSIVGFDLDSQSTRVYVRAGTVEGYGAWREITGQTNGGGGALPVSLTGATVTDANDAVESGFYTVFGVPTEEDPNPVTNLPASGVSFGSLIVSTADLGYPGLPGYIYTTQVFIGAGSNGLETWIRSQAGASFGGAWGYWVRIFEPSRINDRLEALEGLPIAETPVRGALSYGLDPALPIQGQITRENALVIATWLSDGTMRETSVEGLVPSGYHPGTTVQNVVGVDRTTGQPRAFLVSYVDNLDGVLSALDGEPLGNFAINFSWFTYGGPPA